MSPLELQFESKLEQGKKLMEETARRERFEEVAKARAQDVQIIGVAKAVDRGGVGGALGPNDRAAVARQGQDRQGAFGHEELVGDAVVRGGMGNGGHHAALPIG